MIRINTLGYKGYYVLLNIKQFYPIIDEVVIGKDVNVENDYYDEVVNLCKINNIRYYNRKEEPKCESKYIILIGWRWLMPTDTQLVVFHDSLLPRYRGFNPLVSALINGDEHIGVTCLFGEEGYDKGAILGQEQIVVKYPLKIDQAIKLVSELYLKLMIIFLSKIQDGKVINSYNQDESKATYSLWRDEDDYLIDWSWDSMKIKRFIDSVSYPYSGAKTRVNGCILKILDSEIVEDVFIENRMPGKVIFKDKRGLTIVCGKGLLLIKTLYRDDSTLFDYSTLFRLKFTL